jgi:phosphopentomutase
MSTESGIQRAVLIVLDGLGVGALPDAGAYGDEGSDTLGHLAQAVGGLSLPNLKRLGLGNIVNVRGVAPSASPQACFGKMAERSLGKDSTSGHWEICGIILETPFPTYPHGFPAEVIKAFEKAIGRKTLGNYPASGTEIIEQLGREHLQTGYPIVYTSQDSVFQVACHERVAPVATLYKWCQAARKIMTGDHAVARVIARPFKGEPGRFVRTSERRDFSIPPPEKSLLDSMKASGLPVVGIGKIEDLFTGHGLTEAFHTKDNQDGMAKTLEALSRVEKGLIFTNLVDFDSSWGHRNDATGFARGLAAFDSWLPGCLEKLGASDLLAITADHGNDPTTPSTDHSREYVPLLVYGRAAGKDLGIRQSFSDLGQTLTEGFGLAPLKNGTSFWKEIQDG